MSGRRLLWVPFAGFLLLFGIIAAGLSRPADRTVRSQLVGKTLPAFALKPMVAGRPGASSAAFAGRPHLLNVFASWCVPCAAEAAQLMRLKAMGIPVDAIAVRDSPDAVVRFLRRNGDPYDRIGDDPTSAVQLALGSSGVPETFVVDGKGVILEQHVGDVRAEDVPRLAAMVRSAR